MSDEAKKAVSIAALENEFGAQFDSELMRTCVARGVSIGIDKMIELADDFTTMSGALNGTASHWAAQMAIALRRAAGELVRDYSDDASDVLSEFSRLQGEAIASVIGEAEKGGPP